jgi:hypothetical protein
MFDAGPMAMHWAQWRWETRDGDWIDVPELYRRCARVIDAGNLPNLGFTATGTIAAIVMFGDPDYRRAPALAVPMTPYWDRRIPWNPTTASATFRQLADELDTEVLPERRHHGH